MIKCILTLLDGRQFKIDTSDMCISNHDLITWEGTLFRQQIHKGSCELYFIEVVPHPLVRGMRFGKVAVCTRCKGLLDSAGVCVDRCNQPEG